MVPQNIFQYDEIKEEILSFKIDPKMTMICHHILKHRTLEENRLYMQIYLIHLLIPMSALIHRNLRKTQIKIIFTLFNIHLVTHFKK